MLGVPGRASVPSPGPTQRQGESRFWAGPHGGQRGGGGEGEPRTRISAGFVVEGPSPSWGECLPCPPLPAPPLPLRPWAPGGGRGVVVGLRQGQTSPLTPYAQVSGEAPGGAAGDARLCVGLSPRPCGSRVKWAPGMSRGVHGAWHPSAGSLCCLPVSLPRPVDSQGGGRWVSFAVTCRGRGAPPQGLEGVSWDTQGLCTLDVDHGLS